MKIRFFYFLAVFFFCCALHATAQNENLNTEAATITYEELYDMPYDIQKLFFHIQPMYGELFTTNTTLGWGVKAHYYMGKVGNIEASFRTPYTRSFDLMRDAAYKNSTVDNEPRTYGFYELLGTYHVKDEELDTETKFVLYSKRYEGDKWAATVPMHTIIPTKVRRIIGARLGGMAFKSTVDYNQIMEKQGVTLIADEGGEIGDEESVYGNMSAIGFYVGGSMTLIKNVAVKPDKVYGTLVNDIIFTTFFDVNFAPLVTVQDIYINGRRYSSEPIQKSVLGFRGGMEGKFNREFGWAYAAEIGYRPGLKQSGFFVLAKISFPVLGSQLRYQVESFGK